MLAVRAIDTVPMPLGFVSPNDQIGWSRCAAQMITRTREFLRYTGPWL
jgi:hypothetical protein